ncbi:MAG: hypothetical protein ABI994_04145 [Gemmatimonadales bacterium]
MSRSPESPKATASFEQADQLRTEKIRTDLAARLKKACSYLSEEEFRVLLDKMTKVQLEGEGRPR